MKLIEFIVWLKNNNIPPDATMVMRLDPNNEDFLHTVKYKPQANCILMYPYWGFEREHQKEEKV